nr:DUF5839 family protein [Secundilactobacillus collinoides]
MLMIMGSNTSTQRKFSTGGWECIQKNATSGKKTTVLPALGTIASVFTQFGRQDVMVVQTFQSGIDQASQTQVSHLRRVFTTSDAGSPDKIVSKEYEAYMTKNHLK